MYVCMMYRQLAGWLEMDGHLNLMIASGSHRSKFLSVFVRVAITYNKLVGYSYRYNKLLTISYYRIVRQNIISLNYKHANYSRAQKRYPEVRTISGTEINLKWKPSRRRA